MRYMATIYVSDVMESVAMTVEVQGWAQQFGAPEDLMRATYVWQGVGANTPVEWLSRALFLAAENMSNAPLEGRSGASPMGGAHIISGSSDIGI